MCKDFDFLMTFIEYARPFHFLVLTYFEKKHSTI